MSRSYTKFAPAHRSGRDKGWKGQWKKRMRAMENSALARQVRFPDEDLIYPAFAEEVDDIWGAPSDGGNYIVYDNFEHFARDQIANHKTWSLSKWHRGEEAPTKKGLWADWKKWVSR